MKKRPETNILDYYRIRYKRGKRLKKDEILKDFCEAYGYHRKSAIRLLNGTRPDRYGRPGPGPRPRYNVEEILKPLKEIWLATDQMCSKKLEIAIPLWLPYYETTFGFLSEHTKSKLLSISSATIDRMLKPVRIQHPRRGISGTRPGALLKHHIPIKTDHWDITQPGFLEADTVAHCGDSIAGNFVWSITFTDIFSCWTEVRATWNKGAEGVIEQIKHLETKLPFAIQGFDCDNGSEFLNHHLHRYLTERKNPIQFTRARPYRKNDNAHVEQKNWTHVRHLFGYDRFENQALVELMNDLYVNEWSMLQNYFHPSMKLMSKTKVNSRYIKKYDIPKTPYQRLLDSHEISNDTKELLRNTYRSLNPFSIKKAIQLKLRNIFRYVRVTPNVRQRL